MLGKNKVDVIKGFARFIDAHTVEVNGEKITADHILIATGGRPSHPSIPGAEYGIDSDGFFELDAMPKRVAVVGAGYIAVEIAGVMNALGAETHLFVRKHAPLRTFDPMIVETLVEVMNTEGPTLHTESIPKSIVKNADGSLTLALENGKEFTVDSLVWAIGREPATDNLNLAVTGVKTNAKGYIEVDKFQNTNVKGIYAVGDNTGAVAADPGCRCRWPPPVRAPVQQQAGRTSGLQQHRHRGVQPPANWHYWPDRTAGERAVWRG